MWQLTRALLPATPQRPQGGGRRRLDDRAVLAAILYVLQTGCPWTALPASFGISVPTAHRRFTESAKADVFGQLHRLLLDILGVSDNTATSSNAPSSGVTRFRRLARPYDRIGAHFHAFTRLACAVICYRRATRTNVLLPDPK